MKKALSWLLVLCMMFALVGCGGGKTEEPAKTDEPAKTEQTTDGGDKVIKIGMSMPLTGASATSGIPAVQGMTMAAEEINAAGGIEMNGEKYMIEIITEDDQGVPAEAVSAAQKLLTKDKVDILMCSVLSSCGLAIMELAPDYPDILFSTVSCTSDNFSKLISENPDRYFNFFKPEFNSLDYAGGTLEALGDMVEDGTVNFDNKTVAMLLEDTDFGRSFGAAADNLWDEHLPGAQVVATEYFEAGTTDFYATINKIKALDPDIVISLTVAASSGVAYTKQVEELGCDWVDMAVNYPLQAGFNEQAGAAAENLLFVPLSADFEHNEDMKAFREEVLKVYPDAGVTIVHVTAYDIMYFMAEAIEKAGTLNAKEGLAEAYAATDYQGLYGRYVFRDDHTAMCGADYLPIPAGQIQNGESLIVWPESKASAEVKF